jgi:uncharacterized flavoprotein (TIGR03862 family)
MAASKDDGPMTTSEGAGHVAIVGGGPAGLMAAETARAAGALVDVYEAKGSVGRKFLLAGKGGLNLTHSDPPAEFLARYGRRQTEVAQWLAKFDAHALRAWARELGIDTFVGTSGRVFPTDMKAAPLLRRWVHRLREQGVRFHVHHSCIDIAADRTLTFQTPAGSRSIGAGAVVLALGGGSWPQLGSDARWTAWLASRGVSIAPLAASNCGFDVGWSEHLATKYAGAPVKSVIVSDGQRSVQGEFVITAGGVEGSTIYALSSLLRDTIEAEGRAQIHLDLTPGRSLERLRYDLARPRKGRSLTEHLRRVAGLEGAKVALLYEVMTREAMNDVASLAATIKALPLTLVRARPIEEAISTAGGVRFEALDERSMLKALPGVFCAGEMIDWEAPTGGYLLTACMASGRLAGAAAAAFTRPSDNPP